MSAVRVWWIALAWAALAAALAVCPARGSGEARLRRLVAAGRLAPAAAKTRRAHWPRGLAPAPTAAVVAALPGLALAARFGPAVGLVAGVAGGVGVGSAHRVVRRRRSRQRLAQVTGGLRLLRTELAAGTRPEVALRAAAAEAPAFQPAARAAERGDDVAQALLADQLLAPIGHGWRLAIATGAAPGAILARVEDDLLARAAQAREVSAALAGPRSSALLLAGLPALGVAMGTALGAKPLALLLSTGLGHLLLVAGVMLDVAGLAWTARLITAAERS
ncbi:MAG: type II secretion system F family protein [Actinomycetia bacterium]|nr:type II secretion system F family protein [Actinomycetes bacterium]